MYTVYCIHQKTPFFKAPFLGPWRRFLPGWWIFSKRTWCLGDQGWSSDWRQTEIIQNPYFWQVSSLGLALLSFVWMMCWPWPKLQRLTWLGLPTKLAPPFDSAYSILLATVCDKPCRWRSSRLYWRYSHYSEVSLRRHVCRMLLGPPIGGSWSICWQASLVDSKMGFQILRPVAADPERGSRIFTDLKKFHRNPQRYICAPLF